MSFISGIASDIKSLATDPGKVAKDICDAVLPQNMKAVGDVVGGAIDIETGNPLQALSHMADALKDLPQMAQGLPGTTAGKSPSTPAGTAAAEPAPPPPRAPSLQQVISELTALAGGGAAPTAKPACTAAPGTTAATAPAATATTTPPPPTAAVASAAAAPATGTPADVSTSVSYRAPTSARAPTANAAGSQQLSVSLNVGGTAVTVTESVGTRIVGQHNPATGATTWQRVPTTPTLTVTTGPAPTASSPLASTASSAATAATPATTAAGTATASSAPAEPSSTATPTTTTAAAGTASTAASSTGTAAATSGAATSGAAPSSLSSLMSMSNDQFMQAVTSGNIPADVANNPSAMAEIQARMNQITQMNQLVTSMMAAMHQMQMAIIQNIRV
jgi:hypothetical protein